MILAQYTIRSKQDYIFKTNRLVEIVGASKIISEIWEILFEVAGKADFNIIRNENDLFDFDKIKAEMNTDNPKTLVELFCGGGNLTVLYDSKNSYYEANKAFSYHILKEYPGMIPMAVCTEVSGNYREDYAALMAESECEKNRMNPGRDIFILPFAKMDRDTFVPYAGEKLVDGPRADISYESAIKRKRGIELRENNKNIKFLDEIVTQKGVESLLAIVHADGNNMGRKIMGLLGDDNDYGNCIRKMRKFTRITDLAFSKKGIEAMEECREKLISRYPKIKEKTFAFRPIIADGDDFTFICNARFAMDYTTAYLNAVEEFRSPEEWTENWRYSSCAGICIFHSHYPFSRAYSLAEQACDDSAKKRVHGASDEVTEESWVDFHFIHSGVGGNLSTIRDMQNTQEAMARPWMVGGSGKSDRHYRNLISVFELLKNERVPRSAIKEIGTSWESSKSAGSQTLSRVCSDKKQLENKLLQIISQRDELLKTIYDLSEVYDLWFGGDMV